MTMLWGQEGRKNVCIQLKLGVGNRKYSPLLIIINENGNFVVKLHEAPTTGMNLH